MPEALFALCAACRLYGSSAETNYCHCICLYYIIPYVLHKPNTPVSRCSSSRPCWNLFKSIPEACYVENLNHLQELL